MRKAIAITWTSVALMAVYLGWIFFARWSANRALMRSLEERQAAENREIVERHGAGRLSILGFYASRPVIRRGEASQLCYSVSNASSVRMEPPVKDVWPSLSRCVEVTPASDTVYTLVAEDGKGSRKTATVSIKVR
jgi:hypothetical protein